MPLDPDNPYLDIAHPKMTMKKDYRYGCFKTVLFTWADKGWKSIPCGHLERASDPYCVGCAAKKA